MLVLIVFLASSFEVTLICWEGFIFSWQSTHEVSFNGRNRFSVKMQLLIRKAMDWILGTNCHSDPRGIKPIAKAIMRQAKGKRALSRLPFIPRFTMRLAMRNPSLRIQIFRLVDVYPVLDPQIDLFRHIVEYLENVDTKHSYLARILKFAGRLRRMRSLIERLATKSIYDVASLFVVGSADQDVLSKLDYFQEQGISTTIDILGEKTLNDKEADFYSLKILELTQLLRSYKGSSNRDTCESTAIDRRRPSTSISFKPTALSPHFAPLTSDRGIEEVLDRIAPCLEAGGDIIFFCDMEDFDIKSLTLDLFEKLCNNSAYSNNQLGIVIQAYLKSATYDLARVLDLSRKRVSNGASPLWVRLVKGAYFDSELVKASTELWSLPTFEKKVQTDYSFERCVDIALNATDFVNLAFATHNLRSISYVIAKANELGVQIDQIEIQMLYGMGEPLISGVRTVIPNVRVYIPVGELIPGMGYLVRRLIENTSNQSFLTQTSRWVGAKRSYKKLLKPPQIKQAPEIYRPKLDWDISRDYAHHPALEFRDNRVRASFAHATETSNSALLGRLFGQKYRDGHLPIVVDDQAIWTPNSIESRSPTNEDAIVAHTSISSAIHVDQAIAGAVRAGSQWAKLSITERGQYLIGAAKWLNANRTDIAVLEIIEAGKPWKEADGDVTEAIDFLMFYARAMREKDSANTLNSPLGEYNYQALRPRGITAVIGPWNFPLAIPMGMVSGALIGGNCVILKPAEQTPACAFAIVKAFEFAGLPPGVLSFLPGYGEQVGAALVANDRIATIAFTGSYTVGTQIIERAGKSRPEQVALKRVIAEMGGKNPIIIDSDADLDQAIPAVIYSAFGFSGQKCSACSRVIVLERHALTFIDRITGAMQSLIIGDPKDAQSQIGPLIDQASVERIEKYVDQASEYAHVVRFLGELPTNGFFVKPTLVINPPDGSPILTDEIFGPVLCIEVVPDLTTAIIRANATKYALTAGLFSRSMSSISRATNELRAGNIYVNRHITGAIPGRQPFGGFAHSGIGAKAGSLDYVAQFCDYVVISENTVRSGFVPHVS